MKVLVITITWNRLHLTVPVLEVFRLKANYPYRHIIVDNNSTDGTQEWLKQWVTEGPDRIVIQNTENVGRTNAYLQALQIGMKEPFDFQVELGNDIYVKSDNVLSKLVEFYKLAGDNYAAAPRDLFVTPRFKPKVIGHQEIIGPYTFTPTTHAGLMLEIQSPRAIAEFLKTEPKPTRSMHRADMLRKKGFKIGYIEEIEYCHIGPKDSQNALKEKEQYKY